MIKIKYKTFKDEGNDHYTEVEAVKCEIRYIPSWEETYLRIFFEPDKSNNLGNYIDINDIYEVEII